LPGEDVLAGKNASVKKDTDVTDYPAHAFTPRGRTIYRTRKRDSSRPLVIEMA
jgi:hypothetical protein